LPEQYEDKQSNGWKFNTENLYDVENEPFQLAYYFFNTLQPKRLLELYPSETPFNPYISNMSLQSFIEAIQQHKIGYTQFIRTPSLQKSQLFLQQYHSLELSNIIGLCYELGLIDHHDKLINI
jgi:hypothetical protein